MYSSIEQFRTAIIDAGIKPPVDILADGKIHRFATIEKPHDDGGWYVLHDENIPGGAFGDWNTGIEGKWRADMKRNLSAAELKQHHAMVDATRKKQTEEIAQRHRDAAQKARQVWQAATPAGADHPYLMRKQIQPIDTLREISIDTLVSIIGYTPKSKGESLTGRILIVPIKTNQGLSSLEMIDESGHKSSLAGGVRGGGYWSAQKLPDHDGTGMTLLIGEGMATILSATQATQYPAIAALSCHNLEAIATLMRKRYPDASLIILADIGNGQQDAEQAAKAVNGSLAIPTFGDKQTADTTDFNDMVILCGNDAVKTAIENALIKPIVPAWPTPNPIQASLKAVPAFDAEALLPKVLRDWIINEADRMPCPPDFIATAALVALGSVIGARCAIRPKTQDDWMIVPNLWGGIVGLPSAKKSPAISAALKPLDRLIANAVEQYGVEKQTMETEFTILQAQKDAIETRIKAAARDAKKGDLTMLARELQEHQQQLLEKPKLHRFKSNDSTVEKLGELLRDNPNGLLILRDELVGLIASWDKEGREGERAFYLESWNGSSSFDTDRIGRGSIFIPNVCLSIFGGIQPDKLIAYLEMASHALSNDGMLQRFQLLAYPDHQTWEWRDSLPDNAARDRVFEIFEKLSNFDPVNWGAKPASDFVKFPSFCFDQAAQEVFIEWSIDLHQEKLATEEHAIIAQHLAKYDKLFPTLALIFHLVDCATTGQYGAVTKTSALRAAAWCDYLEAHARRCYGLLMDDGLRAAQALSAKIEQGKLADGFTSRDVRRNQWKYLTTDETIQAALDWLEDEHWVKATPASSNGRHTIRYTIHPTLKAKVGGDHHE